MIQHSGTQEKSYLKAFRLFELFEKNGVAQDPSWAHKLRRSAISRFGVLGFPTARRSNEEWKYTDVGPIARIPFRIAATAEPASLTARELEGFTLGEASWTRLVFVDGSYNEHLSSLASLTAGVRAVNLAEAVRASDSLAEQHLAKHIPYKVNAFAALNTAFIHDGALVHIPDDTILEEPIFLLFVSTSQEQDTVSYPRVLILAGKDSKATIIESYESLYDNRYLTNSVTEMVVGEGSTVKYNKIQRQSKEAFHITNTQVVLARDSSFSSMNIDIGGGLVRNNLNLLMGDEGCDCTLNGLYMLNGSQHVDNQVIIDHAKHYTTSRELYKGILDGKSRSVFHGSIIVREGAKKVDARQEDKNLLLSPHAEADTKPAFWIYCGDVKCSHGAACGQIDENALFYLRSRGVGEQRARTLLTRGFVTEIINSIDNDLFRNQMDELVQTTLDSWLGDEGRA